MTFKPMKLRDYKRWIAGYGCVLRRAGSGDYSLHGPRNEKLVPFIKVTHPGNEIPPLFVEKTRKALEELK